MSRIRFVSQPELFLAEVIPSLKEGSSVETPVHCQDSGSILANCFKPETVPKTPKVLDN